MRHDTPSSFDPTPVPGNQRHIPPRWTCTYTGHCPFQWSLLCSSHFQVFKQPVTAWLTSNLASPIHSFTQLPDCRVLHLLRRLRAPNASLLVFVEQQEHGSEWPRAR